MTKNRVRDLKPGQTATVRVWVKLFGHRFVIFSITFRGV